MGFLTVSGVSCTPIPPLHCREFSSLNRVEGFNIIYFCLLIQNKCTPLHIAARDGNEELVEILLEHGASVTALSKVLSKAC